MKSIRCRSKFGMKEKLTALVLGAALMAFSFASCDTSTSDGGDEPNDKPTMYSVTVSSSIEHGKVSASPTTATAGTEITLTAEAASGYSLTSYIVTDANGNPVTVTDNKFTMPEGNVTVSATFTALPPETYTVNIASGIENGTVTASPTSAEAGQTVTLTLAAGEGYELDKLTVKDAGNADVTTTEVTKGESYTFTMPESNVTVTATFKETTPVAAYIGTKAPSEAKAVGDIVFSDGSATPYSAELTLDDDEKAAAIAIIFYTGTELNSGDDTTTSRTLGVGLKHNQTGLTWCTNTATAYSKNITTIQCTKSGDNISGDKNGSDNLKQIGDFLAGNSSTDDTDTAGNYPAFYFAKNYGTTNILSDTYKDGWYLPSIAELFQIWKNKATVDAASNALGGDKFGSNYYWSSSQYASYDDYAYFLIFGNGDWNDFNKDSDVNYVCAVRAFN